MPSRQPGTSANVPSGMTRSEWISRVGIYCLGIAIGLLMVWMINAARRAAMLSSGVDPSAPTIRHVERPPPQSPATNVP